MYTKIYSDRSETGNLISNTNCCVQVVCDKGGKRITTVQFQLRDSSSALRHSNPALVKLDLFTVGVDLFPRRSSRPSFIFPDIKSF